tara:strand:- start:97 stop:426 length:330 start_codon:yes stop_codon:yes gene_type:complete
MLDHEAIRKAYPDVVTIDDGAGAFKADGTKINLVQSDIDAARVILDNEALAVKYKTDRTTDGSTKYDTIGNQLDQLYRDINAGKFGSDAKTGEWFVGITSVKTANPKPS